MAKEYNQSYRERHGDRLRANNRVYLKKMRTRNRDLIDQAKSHPCVGCGGAFPPYVMDLHHRDPAEKRYMPAALLNVSPVDRVIAELAKCDAYCANCHRELEFGLKNKLDPSIGG